MTTSKARAANFGVSPIRTPFRLENPLERGGFSKAVLAFWRDHGLLLFDKRTRPRRIKGPALRVPDATVAVADDKLIAGPHLGAQLLERSLASSAMEHMLRAAGKVTLVDGYAFSDDQRPALQHLLNLMAQYPTAGEKLLTIHYGSMKGVLDEHQAIITELWKVACDGPVQPIIVTLQAHNYNHKRWLHDRFLQLCYNGDIIDLYTLGHGVRVLHAASPTFDTIAKLPNDCWEIVRQALDGTSSKGSPQRVELRLDGRP